MAKSKSKAKKQTKIVSAICLLLSVLLLVTFFMPTYTKTVGDTTYTYNGITMLQGASMSDEDAAKLTLETTGSGISGILGNDTSKEVKAKAQKLHAYKMYHDEDAGAYKVTVYLNIAVLVAGAVLMVASLLSLLTGKLSLFDLIAGLFAVVVSVVLMICAGVASKYFTTNVSTMAMGVGVWFAMISSVLALGSQAVGKFVLKK